MTSVAASFAWAYTAIFHPSDKSGVVIALSVLSIVLLLAVAALSIAYASKVRAAQRLTQNAERQHEGHITSIENLNTIFGEFIERLDGSMRSPHLGLFVNRLKTIFDCLSTSGQSSVCVKLLNSVHTRPEFDGPYVWTAKRDDASAVHRAKFDDSHRLKRYRPDDNKAFADIMSPAIGGDYFFSNNLGDLPDYYNSNHQWPEHYNAAVVVPIKPCKADVRKSTIGFLCVDSLRGTFEEDVSVAILTLVAEIMYRHLRNASEAVLEPPD